MNNQLDIFQSADLATYLQRRDGESRLGEVVQFANPLLSLDEALVSSAVHGCRYVLLGIPEDIGPRANFGNGGADLGFQAFLSRFVNLQSNSFGDAHSVLLLGQIHCADLQQKATALSAQTPAELATLRQLCAELDQRVEAVVSAIFRAGLVPIVIGGGHNNALPLLKALAQQHGHSVHAINLDPHCDFRLREGRHSGNGFSYAHYAGWLDRYFVVGLHELKNSAAALDQLQQAGAGFVSYQQIWQRRVISFTEAMQQAIDTVCADNQKALGIELDTDSISGMPVSAYTNCGVSVADAEYFVWRLAQLPQASYLHLAEAAPAQHPAGLKAGLNEAGQVLSALVVAFLQGQHHIAGKP